MKVYGDSQVQPRPMHGVKRNTVASQQTLGDGGQLQRLGQGMSDAAQYLEARKDALQKQSDLDEFNRAKVLTVNTWLPQEQEYLNLKGRNAFNISDQAGKAYDDMTSDIKSKLSSQRSQDMYSTWFDEQRAVYMKPIFEHNIKERDTSLDESTKASMRIDAEYAARNFTDQKKVSQARISYFSSVKSLAAQKGLTDEQLAVEILDAMAYWHKTQFDKRLELDPELAEEYLDHYIDEFADPSKARELIIKRETQQEKDWDAEQEDNYTLTFGRVINGTTNQDEIAAEFALGLFDDKQYNALIKALDNVTEGPRVDDPDAVLNLAENYGDMTVSDIANTEGVTTDTLEKYMDKNIKLTRGLLSDGEDWQTSRKQAYNQALDLFELAFPEIKGTTLGGGFILNIGGQSSTEALQAKTKLYSRVEALPPEERTDDNIIRIANEIIELLDNPTLQQGRKQGLTAIQGYKKRKEHILATTEPNSSKRTKLLDALNDEDDQSVSDADYGYQSPIEKLASDEEFTDFMKNFTDLEIQRINSINKGMNP